MKRRRLREHSRVQPVVRAQHFSRNADLSAPTRVMLIFDSRKRSGSLIHSFGRSKHGNDPWDRAPTSERQAKLVGMTALEADTKFTDNELLALKPKQFCVFCGSAPESKTREHVIPQWLIKITGDPKRKANFHVDWKKKPPTVRQYAFDQFTFPACDICNGNFAKLESATQEIVISLLGGRELAETDFHLLLDWLDKVRVGIWLSKYILDGNPHGIRPNFYIAQRLRAFDRGVIVYRHTGKKQKLSFIGTFLPSFVISPTAFALVINDIVLINLTETDLCSRRLGFPFLRKVALSEKGPMQTQVHRGLERRMNPILKNLRHAESSGFFQPIYSKMIEMDDLEELYSTEYVANNSFNVEQGLGGVFQERGGKVERCSAKKSKGWEPPKVVTVDRAIKEADIYVHEHQFASIRQSIEISPPHLKRYLIEELRGSMKVYQEMKAHLDEREFIA